MSTKQTAIADRSEDGGMEKRQRERADISESSSGGFGA
jgi:hypothetical protein